MKKYIAMLSATLLLMAACASPSPGPQEAAPGFIARDTLYASYEIPSGWNFSELHSNEARLLYYPEGMDVMEEPSYVILEIFPTGQPVEDIEEVYQEFLGMIEDMLEVRGDNAEVIGHEFFDTQFGGAIEVIINDEFEGRNFIHTQYFLILDDYMAVVSATNFADDNVEGVAEMARHIVDTISFNNLADVPIPELPPNPLGGHWHGNVFHNHMLDLHVTLPDNWSPFPRELIIANFGAEAELSVQLMAASDQDEMLQVFIVPQTPDSTVEDFLQMFAGQLEGEAVTAVTSDITEVEIAGYTYLTSSIRAENDFGSVVTQETFARVLDEHIILAVSFLYAGYTEPDAVAFLQEALWWE